MLYIGSSLTRAASSVSQLSNLTLSSPRFVFFCLRRRHRRVSFSPTEVTVGGSVLLSPFFSVPYLKMDSKLTCFLFSFSSHFRPQTGLLPVSCPPCEGDMLWKWISCGPLLFLFCCSSYQSFTNLSLADAKRLLISSILSEKRIFEV